MLAEYSTAKVLPVHSGSMGATCQPSQRARESLGSSDLQCVKTPNGRLSFQPEILKRSETSEAVSVYWEPTIKTASGDTQRGFAVIVTHDEGGEKVPSRQLKGFEISAEVSRKQNITEAKVTEVWSRDFGDITAVAAPISSCGAPQMRTRSDKSVLKAQCVDNLLAVATKTVASNPLGESVASWQIQLVDAATGAPRLVQALPDDTVAVEWLLLQDNRLVVIYENGRLRRKELKLVEFFNEYRPRGAVLPSWVPVLGKGQEQPPTLKVFDEVFSLGMIDLDAVALTKTGQGVTMQTLVAASNSTGTLLAVPPRLFSARRPVPAPSLPDVDVLTAQFGEVSPGDPRLDGDLPPFESYLPLEPFEFLPEGVSQASLMSLNCEPSALESTTNVVLRYADGQAHSLPYRPSQAYDSLPASYSPIQTILSLVVTLGAVGYTIVILMRRKAKF